MTEAAGGGVNPAEMTVAGVLGEIVWLMTQSAEHKQYLVSDLEWLVMPPVLLRQFRMFHHEGRPAAVVLYGLLSDEAKARLEAGAPTLRPQDWKSGPHARVIRVIAPFGGAEAFERETVETVLKGASGTA